MKKFQFSLDAVLKLRCNERDACRRALAQLFDEEQQLAATRHKTVAARVTQFDELRMLELGGRGVNVDASALRRSYVERLATDLKEIEARRTELAKQIEIRRRKLIQADQAVKALEKLADHRRSAYLMEQRRKETAAQQETLLFS